MAISALAVVQRKPIALLDIIFLSFFCLGVVQANNLGDNWSQRYQGDKGSLFIKDCPANNIDTCPVIRVLNKKPSPQFNYVYIDYIAADYVDRLEKLGHDKIEYDVELNDVTNSVKVSSIRGGINYSTIILVTKDNIQYFEYSASEPYFSTSMQDFTHFLTAPDKLPVTTEISSAENLNN